MGKVKQLFTQAWEEKLLRDENRRTSSSGSRNETDQALSDLADYERYRKEFEEWLDAYEKSFGDEEGKLP